MAADGPRKSAGAHLRRVSHWEGLVTDGRVRYTKMVIRQSFLFLLKEQPIDKITVADICRLAEINRATFYRHYDNERSILSELELDLLAQIPSSPESRSPQQAMAAAVQGVWEEREQWAPLLSPNADPGLPSKLFHFLEEHLPQGQDQNAHRFFLHGFSGLLSDWMTGGFREPAEQVAALAAQYFQDLTGPG